MFLFVFFGVWDLKPTCCTTVSVGFVAPLGFDLEPSLANPHVFFDEFVVQIELVLEATQAPQQP